MTGSPDHVLIETYWNVNIAVELRGDEYVEVLIETYWNVNAVSAAQSFFSAVCINRNILECK